MPSLSIVIPAYNEAERLPRTFELLKQAKESKTFSPFQLSEIWIIDDGSSDETAEIARRAFSELPEVKVHSVRPNQGKGHAVHQGLQLATSDWCLIADADSATPWDQIQKLIPACWDSTGIKAEIAMGSRDLPESYRVQHQSWLRENLGRVFNFAVRRLTGLPFKDTQCGFKLVHLPSVKPWVPRLCVQRFAWDVELLMQAKKNQLRSVEVPVTWEHREGSRINPLRDGIEMFIQVLLMKLRSLRRP